MIDRPRSLALGSALTLSFAASSPVERPCTPGRPAIIVLLYNYAQVPSEILDHAQQRVATIFSHAGVAIEWTDPLVDARYRVNPEKNGLGAFTVEMVLRPRMRVVQPDSSAPIMGTTPNGPHERGGTAFLFYDRVSLVARERQQSLWDMLGCAMAHELGHLLLPAPAHSATGIMRAEWNGDDIRHARFGSLGFTRAQMALIRAKAAACCAAPESEPERRDFG
jgi:hypothetical protein